MGHMAWGKHSLKISAPQLPNKRMTNKINYLSVLITKVFVEQPEYTGSVKKSSLLFSFGAFSSVSSLNVSGY